MEVPYRYLENPPAKMKEFSRTLEEADAIVLASPEYNGQLSGALKNTLDYFYPEYSKKPIGVMTVSSGQLGGINASYGLQSLALSLGGYPMPYKLLVKGVTKAFDENGALVDEQLSQSFDKFKSELIWFTAALKEAKLITN